jgi:restriction system protein
MRGKMLSGWFGEKMVQFNLWLKLDKNVYKRFHNVIIPTANGTTQVDHILVSIYGIFVIETKNFSGWIFGSESEPMWTQVFPGGKKFRFQNPLLQNYRHTKCLSEYLELPHDVFQSVIFFIGECELKTKLPPKVRTHGAATYIRSFREQLLTPEQVAAIVEKLRSAKAGGVQTHSSHMRSLHDRYKSIAVCPKCGRALVERTARNGPNTGNKFLGCTGYPGCRYVKNR